MFSSILTTTIISVERANFRCKSPLSTYTASGNKTTVQSVKIAQIGKGNMFGEAEVVIAKKDRDTTIRCQSTTAKLLRISARDFMSIIKQISPKTILMIKQASEGIHDHISHFLTNKKEIEVRNRLAMMNYEEEKIDSITDKLFNNVLNSKSKGMCLNK